VVLHKATKVTAVHIIECIGRVRAEVVYVKGGTIRKPPTSWCIGDEPMEMPDEYRAYVGRDRMMYLNSHSSLKEAVDYLSSLEKDSVRKN
jgi:hypothetical protein